MSEEPTTPDLVELVREQAEDANRGDLDAVMRIFAEDATLDGRGAGNFSEGRAAIRSFVEGGARCHVRRGGCAVRVTATHTFRLHCR